MLELKINKIAAEADLLISEGFIEPHFFAGYPLIAQLLSTVSGLSTSSLACRPLPAVDFCFVWRV